MHKSVPLLLVVLLSLPTAVGARNVFEVGLGVSGIYDATASGSAEEFLEGMGVGGNWTIGVGVNTRVSVVDVSFLAMQDGEGDDMTLLSSLSLSIPVITDAVYLGIGGGLTTNFDFSEETETEVLDRPLSEVSFWEVVSDSPIHLKVGFDVLFGPAKVGMFYLRETPATFGTLEYESMWDELFRSEGSDKVAVTLQLALF